MKAAQATAAGVITTVLSGRTLETTLSRVLAREPAADAHHNALVQELCYGTLRHLGALRAALKPLLKRPLADASLEALLCVALYQLRHGSAPAHAVVTHAVDAAIALRLTSAKGLVNAILRSYLRRSDEPDARLPASDEALYSHPQWWVDQVRTDHPDTWRGILEAGNQRPPLTLRVNRRKITRDAAARRLVASGIACRPAGEDGLIVESPRNVAELPGFTEGQLSVQDRGAQLAAPFLDAHEGMHVLDACAAPGGKTTHILERTDCSVLALERDPARLDKVRSNLDRAGLNATTLAADAADPATWWNGVLFDRVLADVPCTASGVVRRHPDAKWLRRATDIAQFETQQRRILDALWTVVKPGGRLLYTTCSIFESENEGQVRGMLERNRDAVRCALAWPADIRREGEGQLLPVGAGAEENHDGFFYALFEKRCG